MHRILKIGGLNEGAPRAVHTLLYYNCVLETLAATFFEPFFFYKEKSQMPFGI